MPLTRSTGLLMAKRRSRPPSSRAMISRCFISACRRQAGRTERGGLDVLRRCRGMGGQLPVIIVTARDGIDDRIDGLDLGADDYLVKPFEIRELLARMRAVFRRSGSGR